MEPENQPVCLSLIKRIRKEVPGKNIWIYSGYTFEELTDEKNKRCYTEYTDEILDNIDILVDGEFHIEEKDMSLDFRGSSNQRVIDVKKSRHGNIVLLDKIRR